MITNVSNASVSAASSIRDFVNPKAVKQLAAMNQKALEALQTKQDGRKSSASKKKLQPEIDILLAKKKFFADPKQSMDQIYLGARVALPYLFAMPVVQMIGEAVLKSFDDEEEELTPEQQAVRDAYVANTVQNTLIDFGIDPVTNVANTVFGIGTVAASSLFNPIFLAAELGLAYHDDNETAKVTSVLNFFKKYPGLAQLADIGARIAVHYGVIEE